MTNVAFLIHDTTFFLGSMVDALKFNYMIMTQTKEKQWEDGHHQNLVRNVGTRIVRRDSVRNAQLWAA